jgi:hypothetical protein
MHRFCKLINCWVRRVSKCAYSVFRVLLTVFFFAKHQTTQALIYFKITIRRSSKQNYEERQLASSCLSVRPPAWNTSAANGRIYIKFDIRAFFRKTVGKNTSFIKLEQEWRVLYMTSIRHFCSYLAQFFLEWEIFQTKVAEKIETHILCSITFFLSKIIPFMRKSGKILYIGAGHNDSMAPARCVLCN